MNPRIRLFPVFLLLGLVLAGCGLLGSGPDASPKAPDFRPMTYENLISALKVSGATVQLLDEVEQPFFEVAGKIIQVNGADIQVFEFPDTDSSRRAAESIAPSGGSVGTTMVTWLATPHFFMADQVIALYLGDDPAVMELLEASLGTQIAGG